MKQVVVPRRCFSFRPGLLHHACRFILQQIVRWAGTSLRARQGSCPVAAEICDAARRTR